jgi:hypothetical protein
MRELSCPAHPTGYVRRYRTNGPEGPGVYPQCVPGDSGPTHILTWEEASPSTATRPTPQQTTCDPRP